jgi:hypothetical protein
MTPSARSSKKKNPEKTLPASALVRWATFVRERFEPLSHLALIALFFIGHLRVSAAAGTLSKDQLVQHHVPLFLATLLFFFRLRLFDELKDHETDLEHNPTRPLARGLLRRSDLTGAVAVCLLVETGLVGLASPYALPAYLLATGYSLLMYLEFFIGSWLRPRLTTYALAHTIVVSGLSLSLFSALAGRSVADLSLSRAQLPFAAACWCLFNVFEFGRKTFTRKEERSQVPSYSKIFGRAGAVLLNLTNGALAVLLISRIPGRRMDLLTPLLISVTSSLAVVGALYATLNQSPWGRAYRAVSSAFLIVVLAGVMALC